MEIGKDTNCGLMFTAQLSVLRILKKNSVLRDLLCDTAWPIKHVNTK
jgi:hypothetical protein